MYWVPGSITIHSGEFGCSKPNQNDKLLLRHRSLIPSHSHIGDQAVLKLVILVYWILGPWTSELCRMKAFRLFRGNASYMQNYSTGFLDGTIAKNLKKTRIRNWGGLKCLVTANFDEGRSEREAAWVGIDVMT